MARRNSCWRSFFLVLASPSASVCLQYSSRTIEAGTARTIGPSAKAAISVPASAVIVMRMRRKVWMPVDQCLPSSGAVASVPNSTISELRSSPSSSNPRSTERTVNGNSRPPGPPRDFLTHSLADVTSPLADQFASRDNTRSALASFALLPRVPTSDDLP